MFSDSEEKIIKLIGRNKISIAELTTMFFEGDEVFEANNKVAGIVRRINRKCEDAGLKWKIEGEGTGRKGRVVWKELR
jgi:hypothetical protein